MKYVYGYATNIGTKKSVNQDSLSIMEAKCPQGRALLATICDGMGGLEQGENASGSVVSAFSRWFEQRFPLLIRENRIQAVPEEWKTLVHKANQALVQYGQEQQLQIGTTVTAVLILPDGYYYCIHVGDTRLYQIHGDSIVQLTTDQTFVEREVSLGRMTREQASKDARRNLLLECVGVSETIEPQLLEGNVEAGDNVLLCSDGFRHKIGDEEMKKTLSSGVSNKDDISARLEQLIQTNLERGEMDNITAILVRLERG